MLGYHGSLGLKATWVGDPVGPDHAIDAELCIIWEAAKVASISPVLHSLACNHEDTAHHVAVHDAAEAEFHHRVNHTLLLLQSELGQQMVQHTSVNMYSMSLQKEW